MKNCSIRCLLLLPLLFFVRGPGAWAQGFEEKGEKPSVSLHGSAGLNFIGYHASGIKERAQPVSVVFNTQMLFDFYGVEIPLALTVSDKHSAYSQPFNQFGLSPRYKWITLHLGYRNLNFSGFTLAGHTIAGAGIELNPGKLRFAFIQGRFMRQTPGNPVFTTDSLPTYTRKGFALKLGAGDAHTFFDLIVLRISDDSTSLVQPDTSAIRTPEQNLVVGFNSRVSISRYLSWENEMAYSLYTTNMSARIPGEVGENSWVKALTRLVVINQSSEHYGAIRSAFQFKTRNLGLKLEFRRIAPHYRSMGAYFINNDLQNLTVSPSFGLFKRKIMVSGSLGLQQDNLSNHKKATTLRTIGGLNLSVNPIRQFGLDVSYNNYSINQRAGRMLLNDSLKIVQATRNLTLAPRLIFYGNRYSHLVSAVYVVSAFHDLNSHTAAFTEYNSRMVQLSYTLGLIPFQLFFTGGFNFMQLDNFSGRNQMKGVTGGVSKNFFDNKLNISFNNSFSRMENPTGQSNLFTSAVVCNYRITSHQNFRLNIYYTRNSGNSSPQSNDFTEWKGDISYVYNF